MSIFSIFKKNKTERISVKDSDFFDLAKLSFNQKSDRVTLNKRGSEKGIEVKWIIDYRLSIRHVDNDNYVCKLPWLFDSYIKVPCNIKVTDFFANQNLKSPDPDESATLKDKKKKQMVIGQWTEFLLAHPNEDVTIETLDFSKSDLLSSHPILNNLTALMIVGNDSIKNKVAKIFWEKITEKDLFFSILANRGMMPAGFPQKDSKSAALLLKKYCPEDQFDTFVKLAKEYFGSSVAGIERKKTKNVKNLVKFKEEYTKPVMGFTGTYKVYTATNKEDAEAFLDSIEINEDFLYYEVETPEGNIGKDKMGIY